MLWTEELFGVKKPILAMLHLDALPGDPRFRRGTPLGEIVEHARADLHALQDGGVDGIIFSNEFSFPYQRKMDMVTPAAMAYIIGASPSAWTPSPTAQPVSSLPLRWEQAMCGEPSPASM